MDGIYDSDPKTNRDAKLFKKITVKECMEILGNESSMAGTYELIDIVALKVIERSKIPTQVLRSNVNNIKHAINSNSKYHVGTEIVIDPTLMRAPRSRNGLNHTHKFLNAVCYHLSIDFLTFLHRQRF